MSTCPSCKKPTQSRVCEHCGLTVLQVAQEYRGGKGFVTTEQVRPTDSTLTAPVGFWVAGQPVPKLGSREPKGLSGWQQKVQQAARMKRLSSGQMGDFQPASVVLQFATDDAVRVDLLCRSTLDGLVHSGLLHDDSAIVDLVATRRPLSQSPAGEPGVQVVVTPGEIFTGRVRASLDALLGTAPPRARKLVDSTPRTEPDGKAPESRAPEWKKAVKTAFTGVEIPTRVSMVCEFSLSRWLEPDIVHYPTTNGRDVDKLVKSTILGVGGKNTPDLVDVVASKRFGDPSARVSLYAGALLTQRVLAGLFAQYTQPTGHWSTSRQAPA